MQEAFTESSVADLHLTLKIAVLRPCTLLVGTISLDSASVSSSQPCYNFAKDE